MQFSVSKIQAHMSEIRMFSHDSSIQMIHLHFGSIFKLLEEAETAPSMVSSFVSVLTEGDAFFNTFISFAGASGEKD
jgi:hypothetical protein